MNLRGKVAVITGAGSGIGRATALRLAREGASIVVADWNEAGAKETVASVEGAAGKAAAIKIDVTKSAEITAMLDFADADIRRLRHPLQQRRRWHGTSHRFLRARRRIGAGR